jgi:molecular chaperone DnaK
LAYLAEKSLREAGENIAADIKTGVTEKLEALKKVKDGDDKAAIEAAVAALSTEIQKIGQAAYNKDNGSADHNAGGQGGTEPEPGQPN